MSGADQQRSGSSQRGLPARFTIADFLALKEVRRGSPEVLTETARLERPVRWVHSGEVSNMASLLKGGELLLTTGMGIGRSVAAQREFVNALAQRGVVALAIELGTTLGKVPRALILSCEQFGVCLISFHREVRFVEITEVVHRQILGEVSESTRRGEDLHSRFTEMLLNGSHSADLLTELAKFARNPVVLEGDAGTSAYHVPFECDGASVLGAWESFARGDAGAPPAHEWKMPPRDSSWRRLVILELDGPLSESRQPAITRAVDLVAIALMRDREGERLALRQRGDFLAELQAGTEFSEAALSVRALELGFGAKPPLLLPVAIAVGKPFRLSAAELAWDQICRDLEAELDSRRLPCISGTSATSRLLTVVVGLGEEKERGRVADAIAATVRTAVNRQLGPDTPSTICVGPAGGRWEGLGATLTATVEALPAAAGVEARPWHDVTIADVDQLLWALQERGELRAFVDKQLGLLIERDRAGRADLLRTLDAYCECSGRKTETAKALNIERRSVYHRLRRIEKIVGVDLADGRELLGLHLALRARRYVSSH